MSNNILIKKTLNQIKQDKERKYNATASKIFTISLVLKWLGYLSSIIVFIVFSINNQIAGGLLNALISALSTFIVTTFLDGFAEIIQLLEDIKNKN